MPCRLSLAILGAAGAKGWFSGSQGTCVLRGLVSKHFCFLLEMDGKILPMKRGKAKRNKPTTNFAPK